ncbi:MAG: cobalamin-dependent protein [Planctomycetota bacterium]|nr:cobalamin-dependent protein [Planctomycetota bacterium]
MNLEPHVDRLFEILISGDRPSARRFMTELTGAGATPERLVSEVFWPVYELIERLYREDQMTAIAHNMSTRLLRVLVDQAAAQFTVSGEKRRTVFAVCGPTDPDELGAQMAVDLLEREGFSVSFAGGGIAADEILAQVQQTRPDVLLLFASAPCDLPGIRGMIDQINEIGAVRRLQVVVGGGVFNRAEGLAEEIGSDAWASTPAELVRVMLEKPEQRAVAGQQSVGKKKVKTRAAA